MFVVASFNDSGYEKLASITDEVKKEYCNRHGYTFYCKKDNWRTPDMGFARLHLILEIFELYPDCEWLFIVDCDAMVTNFNIKIEDRINNSVHVIWTMYFNGINVGNLLIKNSQEAKNYIQDLINLEHIYVNHSWKEQQAVIDTLNKYNNIIGIVPARYMSSLQKQIYTHSQLPTDVDLLGQNMIWQQGDWAVHWPGLTLENKIEQAKIMVNNIVR
jgi:hypothetical protein